MVAIGVFLSLMVATMYIYQVGLAAERKSSIHGEAYRATALALSHIRAELQGADASLALGDPPQSSIDYRVPDWQDGRIKVDRRGLPIWKADRRIWLKPDGTVVRQEGDIERVISRLGAGGLLFERVDEQLLKVTIEANLQGPTGRPEDTATHRLEATLGLSKRLFWDDLTVLPAF
ncbi:MAG: hypothetical protein KC910_17855 [Candidatus Eremiobacteraeota bacterium]|nr:hypothetical protein [Candidatus Eremiobacteraeota bacterium]